MLNPTPCRITRTNPSPDLVSARTNPSRPQTFTSSSAKAGDRLPRAARSDTRTNPSHPVAWMTGSSPAMAGGLVPIAARTNPRPPRRSALRQPVLDPPTRHPCQTRVGWRSPAAARGHGHAPRSSSRSARRLPACLEFGRQARPPDQAEPHFRRYHDADAQPVRPDPAGALIGKAGRVRANSATRSVSSIWPPGDTAGRRPAAGSRVRPLASRSVHRTSAATVPVGKHLPRHGGGRPGSRSGVHVASSAFRP